MFAPSPRYIYGDRSAIVNTAPSQRTRKPMKRQPSNEGVCGLNGSTPALVTRANLILQVAELSGSNPEAGALGLWNPFFLCPSPGRGKEEMDSQDSRLPVKALAMSRSATAFVSFPLWAFLSRGGAASRSCSPSIHPTVRLAGKQEAVMSPENISGRRRGSDLGRD